ncbi:hypothetical protein McanMca71_006080 [Microsporum canis]|uniref:Ankyrin repeat domain-containing protein 28 n=1 Tax=Arthroderma otae (strain ATCC MYA-4605 / CBS 113480) TaxID=554155 RepID=C5FNK6_ARTOC|nr:ankyrin repeat domain-containing protein 28 [Microsporum canis CBS 113480]EEQ31620.1 ankyrin repeat domain-containing protein 28 [Microsporum canis CBS 113480]
MPSPTIESLPFEILDLIISFIPVVDYYSIKLTGSRHLTSAIRRRTSSISRQEYATLLQQQDGYGSFKIVPIRTALTITIHRGSESIVRRYIDRYGGAKTRPLSRENRTYTTAFHMAAYHGATNILSLLMSRINLRCRKTGNTALHLAAGHAKLEATRLLVENGADINAINFDEKTPLMMAQKSGLKKDVVRYLRSQGGCVSVEEVLKQHPSRTFADLVWRCTDEPVTIGDMFYWVVFYRDWDRMKVIRAFANYLDTQQSRGPGPNERRQRSLVSFATVNRVTHVIQALVDDGFCINSWTDPGGHNLLHIAARSGDVSLAEMLLKNGIDPNHRCRNGMTPLHMAAYTGAMPVLRALIRSGVSVNLADGKGRTALHCPRLCYTNFVATLVDEYGADTEAKDNNGRTPLHYAIIKKMPDIFMDLLNIGADINAQDRRLETPLMHAIRRRYIYSIGVLMQRGADFTLLNVNGLNAMEMSPYTYALGMILWNGHNPQLKAKKATMELIRQTRVDQDQDVSSSSD